MSFEKVSVIIPVYNGEYSLSKCIDSLLKQTFENFRIYIINDGSTDSTSKILENYIDDTRILVINQSNSGVSSARNVGLDLAKGEYIVFVDADDTVEPNYLEVLISGFFDITTLSICSYNSIDTDRNISKTYKFIEGTLSQDKAIEYLLSEQGPQGYLWNKMFKSEIIRQHNLRFHSDIFMAEDLLFVIEYLLKNGSVFINNDSLYNYMIHSSSSNKTRLSSLREGYHQYFDNFLICIDKMISLIPPSLILSQTAVRGRKGRIAIQYLRANALMKANPNNINMELKRIALENKKNYFNSLDASITAKIIYNLTIYCPKIVLLRDKKHFRI
ncbi:TPA: glycosyltransferase [Streptococcus suis]